MNFNPILIAVNLIEVAIIIAFLKTISYLERKMRCWSPSGWGKFFLESTLPLYIPILFIVLAGFDFKITNTYLFISALFLGVLDVGAGLCTLGTYAEYLGYCEQYRNFKPCACNITKVVHNE